MGLLDEFHHGIEHQVARYAVASFVLHQLDVATGFGEHGLERGRVLEGDGGVEVVLVKACTDEDGKPAMRLTSKVHAWRARRPWARTRTGCWTRCWRRGTARHNERPADQVSSASSSMGIASCRPRSQ